MSSEQVQEPQLNEASPKLNVVDSAEEEEDGEEEAEEDEDHELEDEDETQASSTNKYRYSSLVTATSSQRLAEHDFGQAELKAEQLLEEEARKEQSTWGLVDEDEDEIKGSSRMSMRGSRIEEGKPVSKRKKRKAQVAASRTELKKSKSSVVTQEEDFVPPVYKESEFISKPIVTPGCLISENILHIYNSYGYDSLRPYNLHPLDEDTLVFIGGNYLHFYSISKKSVFKLRRSASGYGFGHIAIHPSQKYYAVAEKGNRPFIVIYTWPEQSVYRVLRNETTRGYSFVDFSPEGDLLCSLGSEPDYLLTIWKWQKERVVLHYKAYSQDVFRASFSLTHPGLLTTCGVGHIRFWKMAKTFTGLKLQGMIGRFGKTEISDVQGFAGLPDAKIVSTSEWGNMLVWDGGLIVVEVVPKVGKTCHDGEIMNILLLETGELLTIGLDGYLKLWESEVVGIAETIVDDSGKFEMEPIFEFRLSTDAMPISVVQQISDEESAWLIQDGLGKAWGVNISQAMKDNEYQPEVIFSFLGGSISAIAASTMYSLIAVANTGGHIWLIEYVTKQTLAKIKCSAGVTKLLWVPRKYDPSGLNFLAAFDDGHIRLFACQRVETIHIDDETVLTEDHRMPFKLHLTQIYRLHKGSVNVMLIDDKAGILYTCGDDKLIFTTKLIETENLSVSLKPLSFVTAPFPVVSLDLHPTKDYRMVIASRQGRVAECRRPDWESRDNDLSLNKGKLHGRRWLYTSVKSQRRREERREARKKEMEEKLKAQEESIAERRVQGVFVDAEIETNRIIESYRRAQHEDDAAELYIPDKPCPVYNIYYRINKSLEENVTSRNFFIHAGGYDAGYIYECKCSRPEPGGFHVVPPTPSFVDDVPIRCFLHTEDNRYLLFGMNDGSIRIMERASPTAHLLAVATQVDEEPSVPDLQIDDEDIALMNDQTDNQKRKRKVIPFPATVYPYDLKNFVCIPMHDPNRGAITDMSWSFDGRYLFSTAQDGTIFAYRWDPSGKLTEEEIMKDNSKLPTEALQLGEPLSETAEIAALTLEEQLQKAEKDRLWAESEKKKEKMRKKIRELKSKFRYLKQKNLEIPEEFRIQRANFEIDPIIRQPQKRRLSKALELVYRRYEWESARSLLQMAKLEKYFFKEIKTPHIVIKDVSHTVQVHTFRSRILTPEFEEICLKNLKFLDDEDIKQKQELRIIKAPAVTKSLNVTRVHARDLIGEYVGKQYDIKTMHQIRNLEARLLKRYERELRWAELVAQKIPDDYVDEVDEREIESARLNLGDYKLKSGESFSGEKVSLAQRRRRVINLKNRMHETVSKFNQKVFALRDEKYQILADCRKLEKKLNIIQRQLPPDLHKAIPPIFDIDPCEEPEKMFEISQQNIKERTARKIEALGIAEKKIAEKAAMARTIKGADKRGKGAGSRPSAPKPLNYQFRKLSKETAATLKARKAFFKPTTELGKAKLELALQFRCFEQDELLRNLNDLLQYFRNRVETIRNERIDLQIDVLLMSLKLLTYIQELDIVKEFESTEQAVQEKFNAQKIETTQAKDRMERVGKRLARVKGEFTRLQLSVEEVNKEATQIIGEKNKFSDYLWKVYKKKIRPEVGRDEKGSDDDTSDNGLRKATSMSSSGESTDSTSQDSGSDLFKLPKPKLNPNVCPDQLDKALYEKVGELRARRTQLEVESEAQAKVVQKVERDFEGAGRIHEKYTGKLHGIGEEVLALQKKKQSKLNQLTALVILRADQVQCIEDKDMGEDQGTLVDRMRRNFPDLTEVILFPKDGMNKLDVRIEELKQETSDEREKHKLARHMMSRLRDEVLKVEKEVASLQERCRTETIAKFGRSVDLDDVCAAIINLEILDELMKLENRRSWHYRERKKIADEIEKARDRLTILTKENSENNILLAILIQRQRDVEYFLWKQSKAFEGQMLASNISLDGSTSAYEFDDESELISNEDALEEMFNLEDILTRQESRITILRATIAACKFKAGLPPLIPLKNVKDDLASKFMTLNELYALRNRKNLMVETVYMSKDSETVGDSQSVISKFSPTTLTTWGVPQHGTFDTTHQHGHSSYPSYAIDEVEEEEEDIKRLERDNDDMNNFRPPSAASDTGPLVSEEGEDTTDAAEDTEVKEDGVGETVPEDEITITEIEEEDEPPTATLPEIKTEVKSEFEPEGEPQIKPDAEVDPETGPQAEPKVEPKVDQETKPEVKAEVEPQIEYDQDLEEAEEILEELE